MRIVSWNCRDGFDSKAAALMALAPDLAIVPESHQRPEIALESFFAKPVPHLWTGTNPTKGLGLFAPGAMSLDRLTPDKDSQGDHAVAGRAIHDTVETTVVGVWTVPHEAEGDRYLAAASGIVDRYATILASRTAILAGDFNVSGRTCLKGLTDFAAMLHERFGLVSAYHIYHDISFGAEKVGTLWWRYHENDEFHCDFVFVPEKWKVTNVEVGSYAVWGSPDAIARSDHAPLIVDLER